MLRSRLRRRRRRRPRPGPTEAEISKSPGDFVSLSHSLYSRVYFELRNQARLRTRKLRAARGHRWTTTLALVLFILLMLTLVILMLLALDIIYLPVASDIDSPHQIQAYDGVDENCGDRGEQWTEVLSWEPRAFLYHNFLSKEECQYLINLAKPRMAKSTIVADFAFIPVEHGEGLQVLHYEVGQKYEPHYDYFLDEFNTKNGGQQIATVLMYLSDVEEGGETVFPEAKGNITDVPWWNELSTCGKKGLSVKPKMGDALLFWSMRPDATLDPSSLHGGCPVIRGNKWSSTKWMHVGEYKI